MPDYEATCRLIESKIEEMQRDNAVSLNERNLRIFSHHFQLLSLEGDLPGCTRLARHMQSACNASPNNSDILLLRAAIAIKLHRFEEAELCLRRDEALWASNTALLLRSDLHVQHGRYLQAQALLELATTNAPTWDGYCRLACLNALRGNMEQADLLYAQAQDELTAKQMHLFAWIDLQRGFMFFERGQYMRAFACYRRAETAFPGYWLTAEHIAELKGAQGEFDNAMASYKRLYEESPKPERAQAIGDLYALSGSQSKAHEWRLKALEGYTATANRGEVYHYHALVDLCCEIAGHISLAVNYARKDIALRCNHATEGDLAWALYRNGQTEEAYMWIEKALSHDIVSGRLFTQAACIYAAVGESKPSKDYLQRARKVNPAPSRARINFGRQESSVKLPRTSSSRIELIEQ